MPGLIVVPSAIARGMDKIEVGDMVRRRTTWGSDRDNTVHKVVRVTKAGKIRLDNGQLFSMSGCKVEKGWGNFVLFRLGEGETA